MPPESSPSPSVDDPRESLRAIRASLDTLGQQIARMTERADNMSVALSETQSAVKAIAAGHKPTFWDW